MQGFEPHHARAGAPVLDGLFVGIAYIVMAYPVMAYIVIAYIVMAYIVIAYIVMAYIVMAYIVMAYRTTHQPTDWPPDPCSYFSYNTPLHYAR